MRWLLVSLALGVVPDLSGQAVPEMTTLRSADRIPHKPAAEFPKPLFRFATIGDLTGGYRWGVFPDIARKIDWLRPDLVMSVGDLIEGYTEDQAQIQEWWDQFSGWINTFAAPFFYVPGNHDLSNALMIQIWEERLGRTYYSFVHEGVTFLVLNSEDGAPGRISPQQVAYVEEILADTPEDQQVLVFLHKPLWRSEEPGFLAIEHLLAGRPYTVFAGHWHRYLSTQRRGRPYYLLATCGGGSRLRGAAFGEFDHLAWVTVYPDTLIMAQIETSGIWPDTVLTGSREKQVGAFLRATESLYHRPLFPVAGRMKAKTIWSMPNPGDHELRVQAYVRQHETLRVSPGSMDTLIPAGDTLHLPVQLERRDGQPWPSVDQPLQWTVTFTETGPTDKRSITRSYRMPCLRYALCRQAAARPKVDGRAEEWSLPPGRVPAERAYYAWTWTGPDDLRLTAQTLYYEDSLYLALRVWDDDHYHDAYRNSWEQDGAAFVLQFPGEPLMTLGFEVTQDQDILIDREQFLPAGYSLAATRTEDGFFAEVGLPLPTAATDTFVLNWMVYDHDQGEDPWKGTKAWLYAPFDGQQTYTLEKSNK